MTFVFFGVRSFTNKLSIINKLQLMFDLIYRLMNFYVCI